MASRGFSAALAGADVTQDGWFRLVSAARDASEDATQTCGRPRSASHPAPGPPVSGLARASATRPSPSRRHTDGSAPSTGKTHHARHALHAHSSTVFLALGPEGEGPDEERPQWGSHVEYVLSLVGYAVGIGNLWRFPMLAMQHGGGAFLVPYFLFVVTLGCPLLVLELCVGQVFQMSASRLWGGLHRRLAGLGWASALTSFTVAVYFNMLIAWTLFYLVLSFRAPLPWTSANPAPCMATAARTADPAAAFWEACVTQQLPLADPDWAAPNWPLVGSLAAAWLVAWGALHNGIESSGKVVLFTATFPYAALLILFLRAATLEGAAAGLAYYVTPSFSKLGDVEVWVAAANQVFFSFGVGTGTIVGYASYTPKGSPFLRDGLAVGLINAGTSLFAGLVVFAILGHLAHEQGVAVSELELGGPGLAFIAYPTAIALLPAARVYAVVFFLMLLSLALDTQMGLLEVGVSALAEHGLFLFRKRMLAVGMAVVCALGFMLGACFATRGGVDLLRLFDSYACLVSLLTICFLELVAVVGVYGTHSFTARVRCETGVAIPHWLTALWTFVSMPLCLLLVVLALRGALVRTSESWPEWASTLGWLLALAPILVIAGGGVLASSRAHATDGQVRSRKC